MTRTFAASAVLAALSLTASSAFAQPAPSRYSSMHNVIVRLPPGPCIDAGGRIDHGHHDACVVPMVVFEPPDPCQRDHGVMVKTLSGHPACALRDPQSGLPTGKRMH